MPRRLEPAMALFPLRLFLGGTFVYAGIQKLSDPGFLHKGAGTYIGSQLEAFSHGTPGGFFLRLTALHFPAFAGVSIAFVEIGVGLLVLTGILTRPAAAAGLGLNMLLFLTASWKTTPYFLGSDIVFVFAWLPFVLAGSEGQPSLEPAILPRPRTMGRRHQPGGVTRRAAIGQALAGVGAASLAIGGLAALLKGSYRGHATATLGGTAHAGTPKQSSHKAASAKPAHKAAKQLPAGAVELGPSSRLPAGQAALYRDPGDGQADVVVRLSDGSLAAHNALCTHAGCQVEFQQGTLFCPCHGSVFNAQTGAVEQGPAVDPLPERRVTEQGGKLYSIPT